jgi:hypothetical protein
MKVLLPAHVAGVVVAGILGFAAHTSLSGADEPAEGVYGMVEEIDPLVGFDWAPPIEDPELAAAAADGATVTDAPCTFGDRPGVLEPQIFRRPIRTTGHLVVTPSGNVSFHCHAAANAGSFRPPLPTSALVVDPVPCFLPDRRRSNDARLVVTPSLHVHLSCRVHPAS